MTADICFDQDRFGVKNELANVCVFCCNLHCITIKYWGTYDDENILEKAYSQNCFFIHLRTHVGINSHTYQLHAMRDINPR